MVSCRPPKFATSRDACLFGARLFPLHTGELRSVTLTSKIDEDEQAEKRRSEHPIIDFVEVLALISGVLVDLIQSVPRYLLK